MIALWSIPDTTTMLDPAQRPLSQPSADTTAKGQTAGTFVASSRRLPHIHGANGEAHFSPGPIRHRRPPDTRPGTSRTPKLPTTATAETASRPLRKEQSMTDEQTPFDGAMSTAVTAIATATDLFEMSDKLTYEECEVALGALREIAAAVGAAKAMIEIQQVALVKEAGKGGLRIGDRLFALRPEGKWRTDWGMLKRKLRARAYVTADGERLAPDEAVENVMNLMQALFLAPAAVPKIGAVQEIFKAEGLSAVARWEKTGEKIEVLNLEAPE